MKFRRILAILLCLSLFLPLLPTASAGEEELTDSIEDQIRAFADSIDQSDAVDDAARALAVHGMTKGGKKLSVGKSHALTATLFNSELLQTALTEACTAAIRDMQQLDLAELENVFGVCTWDGAAGSFFNMRVYDSADPKTRLTDWTLTEHSYTKTRNAYDESLDWIAGGTALKLGISRSKVTADTATYSISITVSDRFDFATSGNSLFKDLISGIGALFFKEFDWECTVSFELTVSCECSHGTADYHWTYDRENRVMISDSADGFRRNDTTVHTVTNADAEDTYYYQLEEPVRLLHDRPWVLEYDIQNPGMFLLAPVYMLSGSQPSLMIYMRDYLFVYDYENVKVSEEIKAEYGLSTVSQHVRHYYGTSLRDLFSFTTTALYTFRLENQVDPDGSNMIYLTVRNTDTGELCMDRVPMDDYYKYESWTRETVLHSEENDWISGKDLHINYIGNARYQISAGYFDLRIWENGEEGESVSYYEKTSVTAPTCTEQGYTTYTCSACGHSYNADYTDALGHSFGAWERTKEPTCTENGEEQRDCANCDHYETREIAANGHDCESVVTEPTCTEQGYTTYTCTNCGDSYVDDYTDPVEHRYEGGYCTWCGENENYVKWLVATTSLNGTIDLNIYVVLSEDILNDPDAVIRFEHSGVTVDVPVSEGIPSKKGEYDCYRYSCEIYAKQVADTVTVQVVDGSGTIGNPLDYSVMKYCVNQINKSDNEKQVAVCKAMLNYAAAAQTYFGYNTENLANASLSEADKVLPEVDASDCKFTVVGSEPGIQAKSATLMLEAEVSIRVYFTLEDGYDISDFTFTIDGEEVEVRQNNKGYYIESDGIPAKELENMHQFSVGGLTVNYGALSYVHSKATSDKTELNERNLAKALYAYYAAAEALLG